jgi:hypothetical protein
MFEVEERINGVSKVLEDIYRKNIEVKFKEAEDKDKNSSLICFSILITLSFFMFLNINGYLSNKITFSIVSVLFILLTYRIGEKLKQKSILLREEKECNKLLDELNIYDYYSIDKENILSNTQLKLLLTTREYQDFNDIVSTLSLPLSNSDLIKLVNKYELLEYPVIKNGMFILLEPNGEYCLATNKQNPTPIEKLKECEYGYLSQNNMKIILRMLINDRMIFD